MDSKVGINELCRLCLSKERVKVHIFEGSYKEDIFLKISTCLPVNISYEDKLPKRICTICSKKLNVLYQFCNKSAESEKQLLDWFNQYGTGNETSNDSNLDSEMDQCGSEIEVKEEVISFLTDDDDNYNIKIEKVDLDNYDLQQQENEMSYKEPSDPIELDTVTNNAVEVKQENYSDGGGSTATNNLQAEINSRFTKMPLSNSKRRRWDEKKMAEAITTVREKKMGYLKASKYFQVPRTTLFRLCEKRELTAEKAAATNLGRKTLLGKELEKQLVDYSLKMESKFHGLTRNDVRRMAYMLVKRNNIPNPFGESGMASRKWLNLFLKRNKKILSLRRSTGTSFAREFGFNKENVGNFFHNLEEIYAEHNYPPNRIYNVDESSLSVVESKIPHVIGFRGKRQVASLKSSERGSLMTTVICMSAIGHFVPPYIIFPRKNMNDQLMRGCPPGSVGVAHPSGWMQMHLFTDWFRHFIKHTNPTSESKILLVLDGQYSHIRNIDVIELAREHYVKIVSIPPHTTHKLQPLDKTFMGPLKVYYSEEIRTWIRNNNRPLSPFDTVELFGNAYLKAQTGEIAVNGFRYTGIWPLNKNIFSDVDFIAGENDAAKSGCTSVTPSLTTISASTTSLPKPEPLPGPSTSLLSLRLVSPYEISPVPQNENETSNSGRKNELIEANKKKKENKITKRQEKNKTKNKKYSSQGKPQKQKILDDSSDSDENLVVFDSDSEPDVVIGQTVPDFDDAACMFCERLFSTDLHGEMWVKCFMCALWAHNDCAGPEFDTWICDFCK